MPMNVSGLVLDGEVRDGKVLRTARGELLAFSRVEGGIVFYKKRPGGIAPGSNHEPSR